MPSKSLADLRRDYFKKYFGLSETEMARKSIAELETEFFSGTGRMFGNTLKGKAPALYSQTTAITAATTPQEFLSVPAGSVVETWGFVFVNDTAAAITGTLYFTPTGTAASLAYRVWTASVAANTSATTNIPGIPGGYTAWIESSAATGLSASIQYALHPSDSNVKMAFGQNLPTGDTVLYTQPAGSNGYRLTPGPGLGIGYISTLHNTTATAIVAGFFRKAVNGTLYQIGRMNATANTAVFPGNGAGLFLAPGEQIVINPAAVGLTSLTLWDDGSNRA